MHVSAPPMSSALKINRNIATVDVEDVENAELQNQIMSLSEKNVCSVPASA